MKSPLMPLKEAMVQKPVSIGLRCSFVLNRVFFAFLLSSVCVGQSQAKEAKNVIKYLHIPTISRSLIGGLYTQPAREMQRQLDGGLSILFPNNYCDVIRIAKGQLVDFDIVFTPTHISPQLIRDDGYIPLLSSQFDTEGIFAFKLHPRQSDKHYKIGLPDQYAAVTYIFQQQVENILSRHADLKGIQLKDIEYVYHTTHSAAIMSLLEGKVDAIAVIKNVFEATDKKIRKKYAHLDFVGDYPSVLILAKPGLSTRVQEKIISAFSYHEEVPSQHSILILLNMKRVSEEAFHRLLLKPDIDISDCMENKGPVSRIFSIEATGPAMP